MARGRRVGKRSGRGRDRFRHPEKGAGVYSEYAPGYDIKREPTDPDETVKRMTKMSQSQMHAMGQKAERRRKSGSKK